MSNTFGKEITSQFFSDADGWEKLRAHWSTIMQDKKARAELTSVHHLIYLAITGRDWTKAFTPAMNSNKLAHQLCDSPYYMLNTYVLSNLRWPYYMASHLKPFDGLITEEGFKKLLELLPTRVEVDTQRWNALEAQREAFLQAKKERTAKVKESLLKTVMST